MWVIVNKLHIEGLGNFMVKSWVKASIMIALLLIIYLFLCSQFNYYNEVLEYFMMLLSIVIYVKFYMSSKTQCVRSIANLIPPTHKDILARYMKPPQASEEGLLEGLKKNVTAP